ncbi:MAG TPA: hypothetical protein EYH34_07155, partial [Planctomycetes bacterium]|nr:hypothetical protein [Planctomycetota bacterium]
MNCWRARSLLSNYHDGELPHGKHRKVAEHIRTCSRCGEQVAFFADLSRAFRSLADPEPPEGLWAQLESRLDAEVAGQVYRAGPQPDRRRVAV